MQIPEEKPFSKQFISALARRGVNTKESVMDFPLHARLPVDHEDRLSPSLFENQSVFAWRQFPWLPEDGMPMGLPREKVVFRLRKSFPSGVWGLK